MVDVITTQSAICQCRGSPGEGGGEVLPEQFEWGVRNVSQNPYPIYGQKICHFSCPIYNLTKNSMPYLYNIIIVAHAFYSYQPLKHAGNTVTENNKITNTGISIK